LLGTAGKKHKGGERLWGTQKGVWRKDEVLQRATGVKLGWQGKKGEKGPDFPGGKRGARELKGNCRKARISAKKRKESLDGGWGKTH